MRKNMYALRAIKVFARSCRRSSSSTSCSSHGQWRGAKHSWSPCQSHNRTSCRLQPLRCKLLQPAVRSIQRSTRNPCPRSVLEASIPGVMIDGHRNTSCDKTSRSRTWLDDKTGFMAPSISDRYEGWPCMTCGKQTRTKSLETHQKKHSLRDVTARVPQPCAQDFVHGFCRRVVFKFPTLDLRDGRQRCQDSTL